MSSLNSIIEAVDEEIGRFLKEGHIENINEIKDNVFKRNSIFIENSFFNKVIPIWNNLPKNLRTERHSYQTIKAKMKRLILEKFRNELNLPEYNKKCWKDFKFH